MPRVLGLFPSALAAASRGMSERAWEREARSLGLGARSSEMLSLWRVAKTIVTNAPSEPFQPIEHNPAHQALPAWPSKNATGVAQTVTLTYRDRATGQIKQTWWRTVTENGISREQAMATAINSYSEHAESYEQDLIGATHTSAYRLTPMDMLP
jgi:hypothetical protein